MKTSPSLARALAWQRATHPRSHAMIAVGYLLLAAMALCTMWMESVEIGVFALLGSIWYFFMCTTYDELSFEASPAMIVSLPCSKRSLATAKYLDILHDLAWAASGMAVFYLVCFAGGLLRSSWRIEYFSFDMRCFLWMALPLILVATGASLGAAPWNRHLPKHGIHGFIQEIVASSATLIITGGSFILFVQLLRDLRFLCAFLLALLASVGVVAVGALVFWLAWRNECRQDG